MTPLEVYLNLFSYLKCSSLNCDFNSNDCAWFTLGYSISTWTYTGFQIDDAHGGYLQIPKKPTSDIDQWASTSGLSQLTTSVHNLWYIPQSGCFTFSYRFYTTTDSKLTLTLEQSFGEKMVLWDIKGEQSIDWSKASVYIDSSNAEFRLDFTASITLKNSLGLQADWIVSLDDFTFVNDKCLDPPQKVNAKIEDTLTDEIADIGKNIYTSGPVDIKELVCFSFTYFYTITNSQNVGSLLIMLETMSSDGKQAVKPREILPIEKIPLHRELSLNRNHFERTIVVDRKSFYTISLAYAEETHSSVVLVDDVAIKMERCPNESPKQETDTTVVLPQTETPPSTTTECCITEPCICVQSTPEMPTFNPSRLTTFVTHSKISAVPTSTIKIDQEISSTPITQTEHTISEESTTHSTEVLSTRDQSTTFDSLSSTQTTVHSQTNETPLEEVTSSSSELQSTLMDHIISTTAEPSPEKTQFTNSTEAVVTTTDQNDEPFESSTKIISTTDHQNFEPNSNTTQAPQVIHDPLTEEHNNRTDPFDAINFGNLGLNLITIFKFFFGERSFIASLSGLAGLSILMISILILALNWKKQSEVRPRELVVSAANGELELNTYTFRRRTITLSRLEDMSNSKPPLKLPKGENV
uniref:MAM domain-containing protein n=1 Tax=Tetranychus urticae TaxID=32264 RepID=T1K8B6_TETUR